MGYIALSSQDHFRQQSTPQIVSPNLMKSVPFLSRFEILLPSSPEILLAAE
jgi:hypothetical protein